MQFNWIHLDYNYTEQISTSIYNNWNSDLWTPKTSYFDSQTCSIYKVLIAYDSCFLCLVVYL
jgi:hypothetical protein